MKKICDIDSDVLSAVRRGVAIPAQVLALNEDRSFAPKYQRALCRYFIDAGVGGIAVGVHSTQFAIRDPKYGLFETVMRETSRFIDEWCRFRNKKIRSCAACRSGNRSCRRIRVHPRHRHLLSSVLRFLLRWC